MGKKAELKAKISMDESGFKAGLKRAEGAAVNFADAVGSKLKSAITSPVTAIAGAIAGALTFDALKNGIKGVIEAGAKLQKLHVSTGLSIDDLSIIRDLGLELEDLKKMSPEEQFAAIESSMKGLGKEDFGNLTRKGAILRENAEQFQRTTVAFKMAKVSLENSFLGAAVVLAPVLEKLAKFTSGLRVVQFGSKLGAAIEAGMQTLYGFFLSPENALNVFRFGLDWAMKEGINVLMAGFNASIAILGNDSLWDGMGDALVGIADALGSALMTNFSKATAYLFALIDAGMEALPEWMGGGKEKKAAQEAETNDRARQFDSEKKAAEFEAAGDPERAAKHRALAAKIGAEADEQQKIANGLSVEERAKRIMASGEVGKTAEAMKSAGKGLFTAGLQKMQEAQGDAAAAFRIDDVTGAGIAWGKMKDAGEKARKTGEKAMEEEEKAPEKPKFTSDSSLSRQWSGVQGAAFASFLKDPKFIGPTQEGKPITGWGGSSLNQGAFNQSPILTVNDRRAIEDNLTAAGNHVRKAGVNAYHAIRSGDKARAKEAARQKLLGAQGLDKTNGILEEIHKAVTAIPDGWE